MRNKIKEFIKKYIPGFLIGTFLCGMVNVYAESYFPSINTTYDNSDSGMSSTNVQDALDELYNFCMPKAGEQIIEDNNLEKDPYECRYFFTGASPNNYITFNGEDAGWRILSVECDNSIKIVRNDYINSTVYYWDSYNNYSNWNRPVSANSILNGTYYNSLTSTAKNQIVSHSWGIGPIKANNNDLSTQIKSENSTKWTGKIALLSVSEILRTTNNTSCNTMWNHQQNVNTC